MDHPLMCSFHGPPYVPGPASRSLPELPSSSRVYLAQEERSRIYSADPQRPLSGRPNWGEPGMSVSSLYAFAGPAPTSFR